LGYLLLFDCASSQNLKQVEETRERLKRHKQKSEQSIVLNRLPVMGLARGRGCR